MDSYNQPKKISALDAKFEALKISFSPVVFQATYAMVKLGILEVIANQGDDGACVAEIAKQKSLSEYGVQVLLDVGLSIRILWLNDDKYILDKVGHFILYDKMAQVNLNFMQDVCYQGLFQLVDAIKTGRPEGLKVFGDWKTIYPALPSLPDDARHSWFEFDHYYSDNAFTDALPIVFAHPTKKIFDIGGNTGKWAKACLNHDPDVHVTIVDLPQQLKVAMSEMAAQGLADRVNGFEVDWLLPGAALDAGADVIWMSQFLDCFSEDEILTILRCAADAMDANARLYILELCWDRQTYEASAFSINCTSIYFTCMANGNSRMYHSKDLIKLIHQAGLYIDEDIDHLGATHTLFGCKKKPS
jgi:hypothetical protein